MIAALCLGLLIAVCLVLGYLLYTRATDQPLPKVVLPGPYERHSVVVLEDGQAPVVYGLQVTILHIEDGLGRVLEPDRQPLSEMPVEIMAALS